MWKRGHFDIEKGDISKYEKWGRRDHDHIQEEVELIRNHINK